MCYLESGHVLWGDAVPPSRKGVSVVGRGLPVPHYQAAIPRPALETGKTMSRAEESGAPAEPSQYPPSGRAGEPTWTRRRLTHQVRCNRRDSREHRWAA